MNHRCCSSGNPVLFGNCFPSGFQGIPGPPGPQGIPGPPGPPGAAGAGAIIPYASGIPAILTATALGLVETTSVIGFGSSAPGIAVLGNTIDLTGLLAAGGLANFAFTVPRTGTITSVAANFSALASVALLGTATVRAQLYRSTNPLTNVFTAIPSTLVTLAPSITFPITLLQNSSGIVTGLSEMVNAGDRLLMVFSITTSGLTIVTAVTGYASAGVAIS